MGCTEKGYWHSPAERTLTFGVRRERAFTGKRLDTHYYRGHRWLGPTNAVGKPGPTGKIVLLKTDENVFGLMPV